MYTAINNQGKKVAIEESNDWDNYFCEFCESKLTRKLGLIYQHHYAHTSLLSCDSWRSNKTEWHRRWQATFPVLNQEVIISNVKGKHIADVSLENCVLEFQHSPLSIKDLC